MLTQLKSENPYLIKLYSDLIASNDYLLHFKIIYCFECLKPWFSITTLERMAGGVAYPTRMKVNRACKFSMSCSIQYECEQGYN